MVKRMGKKKALVALGHLILRIAYHILLTKEPYKELGTEYLAERETRERTTQHVKYFGRFYSKANYRIKVAGRSVDEVVRDIRMTLKL
ncbi:MAG: hypothetical protein P4L69_13850 [Desulfosporosinus sp.]|nr:hypothetical protein [Desulfosporosinus sp.]